MSFKVCEIIEQHVVNNYQIVDNSIKKILFAYDYRVPKFLSALLWNYKLKVKIKMLMV